MNGSEQLNATRNLERNESPKKNQNPNPPPNKKIVDLSKNALMTQYTYEYIINSINNNKELNQIDESKVNDEEEDKTMPKLITLLYNICFGPKVKKMNYRFIGSIIPNTGFYLSVKDTLDFFFFFFFILRKKENY